MNIPKHIAIIPDGNRRWAKERGLEPWEGHEAGAKNIEKLVRYALDKGVESLTFWGSSLENLQKRPLREKQELLRVYETYFKKLAGSSDIHENEVKVNVLGRWREQFPASLGKIVDDCVEKTGHYEKKALNFMLAYSGDDEMVEAVRKIVASGTSPKDVSGDVIKQNLLTSSLPAVDLLIRTGGEPHLSAGFMMWDIANAEFYFSPRYFPDFNEAEFEKAFSEYEERGRRHGK